MSRNDTSVMKYHEKEKRPFFGLFNYIFTQLSNVEFGFFDLPISDTRK